MTHLNLNRRDFLGLSAGFALSLGATEAYSATSNKRLVVVLLRGAVDGLSVVIPYAEDGYYQSRPTIAIARPGAAEGGLALDANFALHPALANLMPLWNEKQLAFVHAAGSPYGTRSHFDAQLFIENGTPGNRTTVDGWMNRLLATLPGRREPTEAVAIGPTLPWILKGKLVAANLPLGGNIHKTSTGRSETPPSAFDKLYVGNDALSQSYRNGRVARSELLANMPEEAEMADNGAPPPVGFPAQAAQLAGLMSRDARIRFVVMGIGGWDTHVRQGNHVGKLAENLRSLSQGLTLLARGLGSDWSNTVVIVISEFGRTVRENGIAGTDHGHGNAIWVLGGRVRGGRVYGEWPGLASAQLYQGRDLAVTTDYRHVLAPVLQRHVRVKDRDLDAIFPDLPPPRSKLELVES